MSVIVSQPFVLSAVVGVDNVVDLEVETQAPVTLDIVRDATITGIGSVVGTTNQIAVSTAAGVATVGLANPIITPANLTVSGAFQVDSPSTFNDDVTITSPFQLNADVGGDLQGSLPNPTVHRLQGIDIHNSPDNLDLFQYKTSNNKIHWVTFAEAGVAEAVHTHTLSQITDYDPCDPTKPLYFVDDFTNANSETGEIGIAGWNISSSAITSVQSAKDHPGVIRMRCPSTSGTVGSLTLTPNVSNNNQFAVGDVVEWRCIFKDAQTNTDVDYTIGLLDAWTAGIATTANGVYIRKTTAGTQWIAYCENAGATSQLTLFTQDTNWHSIRALWTGSSWKFYDGATYIGEITTNIPSSSTIVSFTILQTPTGTVNRQQDFDFISVKTGTLSR
jgi:hypothetical protein